MPCVLKKRGSGVKAYHPVQYRDWRSDGTKFTRTVKGFADRQSSLKLAVALEDQARQRRHGIDDSTARKMAVESSRPIGELVDEFELCLKNTPGTAKDDRQVISRLKRLLECCDIKTLGDVRESAVIVGVSKFKECKKPDGYSNETCKHAYRALKQFTSWCARDGRIGRNPLAGMVLRGFNPKLTRRHPRRALTDSEIEKLLAYYDEAPPLRGRAIISGLMRERYLLVRMGTGFRNEEVRSLTPESFDLNGDPPTVRLPATVSKHRDDDVQVIEAELAAYLRPWLCTMPAGSKLFRRFWKPWELLKADLQAVGIPYKDERGFFADCHALRHTFVTRLLRSKVDVTQASRLARHSSIDITVDRYGHLLNADAQTALAGLPKFGKLKPFSAGAAQSTIQSGNGNGHQELQSSLLLPTEPKVAGSSPARCDEICKALQNSSEPC